MPAKPRTPQRAVRVHDDVWFAAQERAAEEGTSVSAVVVRALERYGKVKTPKEPRAAWGSRSRSAEEVS